MPVKARSTTIPSPSMGIDTESPISEMDPLYALEMENFFPGNGRCDLRGGSLVFCDFSAAPASFSYARSMALHRYQTGGTEALIMVGDNAHVYKITSGAVLSDTTSTSDPENYFTNFRGRLFMQGPTGTYPTRSFNGVNVVDATFTGPSGDDLLLFKPKAYKNRLYLCGFDASIWYGGVDAITGTLTQFDLQSIFPRGGRVQHIDSFSPGGAVAEEYFLIVSEYGDLLVYQGDYPGSTTWGIVGKYYIGSPMGRGSYFKTDNDLLIIAQEGLLSVRQVLAGATGSERYLTRRIQSLYRSTMATATASGDVHAINGIFYPKGQYLIINVPIASDGATLGARVQLVQNTITGAWTKYTGWKSASYEIFLNQLRFGTNEGIHTADSGYYDEDPSSHSTVLTRTIKIRPAFNYLGDRESVKQFTQAQPIIYQSEGLSLTMDSDVDFSDTTATSTVTDTTDTAYKLYKPIMGLNGVGNAVSIRIDGTVTTKRISLQAIKVCWNEGDI